MPWLVGYDRKAVNWFPTIDDTKGLKCGMCMNCGKKVYSWLENKPIVSDPYNCVVGCSTCANLCFGKAISFPHIEELRSIYQENNIWSKVTQQLKNDGIIK